MDQQEIDFSIVSALKLILDMKELSFQKTLLKETLVYNFHIQNNLSYKNSAQLIRTLDIMKFETSYYERILQEVN